MMKRIGILIVAVIAQISLCFAQTKPNAGQSEDSKLLFGTWTIGNWTERDKSKKNSEGTIIFLDNGTVSTIDGIDTLKGIFTYNPLKELYWIDITWKTKQADVPFHGIIKWVDNSTARLNIVAKSQSRPISFEDDPDLDRSNYLKKQITSAHFLKSFLTMHKWDILLLYEADKSSLDKKYQTVTFYENNTYQFEGTAFVPGSSGKGRYEINTNKNPYWIDFYADEGEKMIGLIQEFMYGFKLEIFRSNVLSEHPIQFSDVELGDPSVIKFNPNFLYLQPSKSLEKNNNTSERKIESEVSKPEERKETESKNPVVIVISSRPGENITDAEGNTYRTIVLGNGQQWMAENLRTSRYNNGEMIPNITKKKDWYQSSAGAWCYYDNSSSYNDTYGKLYNWYAIKDNRQLCPTGWRVPTLSDWNRLNIYLDNKTDTLRYMGDNTAGGKLKSTDSKFWVSPNSGATDEIGFSSIAAGERIGVPDFPSQNPEQYGIFDVMGYYSFYWTSTKYDADFYKKGVAIVMSKHNASIGTLNKHWTNGFCIRCIKD